MEWFHEFYNGVGIAIKVKRKIVDLKSDYQHIQVFETLNFGKMLVLDGKIQLTERDEAFYHEMLVHVPMITHKNPKKVLIIGGGDGGSLREVLKHDPSDVVMVELDKAVVDVSKEYIGIDCGAFDDERVSLFYEDGIVFVKNCDEKFDVIIVDGTDPNPFSEHIISPEFYDSCRKISDVFVTQSQSPFVQQEYFLKIYANVRKVMDAKLYLNYVPTYPLCLWSYIIHSKSYPGYEVIKRRYGEREIETKHYNPEIHVSSFSLPNWVKELLKSSSP